MEFDSVVNARKSARKFKSQKPDWKDIVEAIDSALKIPLAGNLPTLKFVLIDDGKLIKQITQACQQDFISKAHYLAVICSDPTEVVRSYDERGERYVAQQAGASIEQFLLKLTDLGLDACWVGAFVDDQIRRFLKIPAQIKIEAVIPIGYGMNGVRKKRKPSLDNSLYFNEYNNKFMEPVEEVEAH